MDGRHLHAEQKKRAGEKLRRKKKRFRLRLESALLLLLLRLLSSTVCTRRFGSVFIFNSLPFNLQRVKKHTTSNEKATHKKLVSVLNSQMVKDKRQGEKKIKPSINLFPKGVFLMVNVECIKNYTPASIPILRNDWNKRLICIEGQRLERTAAGLFFCSFLFTRRIKLIYWFEIGYHV